MHHRDRSLNVESRVRDPDFRYSDRNTNEIVVKEVDELSAQGFTPLLI
jgi:hypothetical protein